jgi:hypothetical protein
MLIGTPGECVAGLRRRGREWCLTEVILGFAGADVLKRLGDQVLPHV